MTRLQQEECTFARGCDLGCVNWSEKCGSGVEALKMPDWFQLWWNLLLLLTWLCLDRNFKFTIYRHHPCKFLLSEEECP